MPAFFVPFVEVENREEAYRELATAIGATPRPLENRIYSMLWRHDGVVWTAKGFINFKLAEWQQAKRQGQDPREMKAIFQSC